MRKNILYALAFVAILFVVASCGDDDNQTYDKEWKAYNERIFDSIANVTGYFEVESLTNNGSIYMKRYTDSNSPFAKLGDAPETPIYPTYGDSVIVRYVGWRRYDYTTSTYIFDGTEEGSYYIDGVERKLAFNKTSGAGFRLTGGSSGSLAVDGWITALYRMKEGDATNVVIPYQLAYGTTATTTIPAFTTLWFDMKLVKVIKQN